MRFERTHDYPAPADEVLAMLLDPDFRELVCRTQEAQTHQVQVSAAEPPATRGLADGPADNSSGRPEARFAPSRL